MDSEKGVIQRGRPKFIGPCHMVGSSKYHWKFLELLISSCTILHGPCTIFKYQQCGIQDFAAHTNFHMTQRRQRSASEASLWPYQTYIRQKQVNFLVYTQDSQKIGSVNRQNKSIIWLLGSVFFLKNILHWKHRRKTWNL